MTLWNALMVEHATCLTGSTIDVMRIFLGDFQLAPPRFSGGKPRFPATGARNRMAPKPAENPSWHDSRMAD